MDTSEIWQHPVEDSSVRDDLRLYQARYLRIVERTIFLNERYFQIFAYTGMTIIAFVMAFVVSPYRIYSSIWAVTFSSAQWYLFALYEKLRTRIEKDADQRDPMAYFSRKLDIIILIADIRKIILINSCILVIGIWMTRPTEKLFDQGALMLGITIILLIIVSTIQYRFTIMPVRKYLKKLIKALEESNVHLIKENNI